MSLTLGSSEESASLTDFTHTLTSSKHLTQAQTKFPVREIVSPVYLFDRRSPPKRTRAYGYPSLPADNSIVLMGQRLYSCWIILAVIWEVIENPPAKRSGDADLLLSIYLQT